MDLERIKQNFRIRSGRSKQKKSKSVRVSNPKEQAQAQAPSEQPSDNIPAPEPSKEEEQQEPEPAAETEVEEEPEKHEEQEIPAADVPDAGGEPNESVSVENEQEPPPDSPPSTLDAPNEETQTEEQSDKGSPAPEPANEMTEPSSEAEDFDLEVPTPRAKPPSLETLSELLFSSGHLDALLHYPPHLARFSAFLHKYRPHYYPLLGQYLETQKAIRAVEYANAVADGLKPHDTGKGTTTETRGAAAILDAEFEEISSASFNALVGDALPCYISYSLVRLVTECLTNEITGRNTPIMRDLVEGLSEVFCLADPNQQDNPIVFASEEFYRLTRYGPEEVLNNNCRFLQGRKTNPNSPRRLKAAIEKGEEINETLLNYRRDGKPFVNLLMVAPLHDRHGKVKYHIGAQVDVTGLIQGGRAIESFQRYLNRRAEDAKREEKEKAQGDLDDDQRRKKRALAKLRDLSDMFDLEESAVVQSNSRSNSSTRDDDDNGSIASVERTPRRVYVDTDDDSSDVEEDEQGKQADNAADWSLGDAGDGRLSGKLPGVYDSFMLVRAAPSLRIVFVSPKLRRIGNILQTPFLSHVAAPKATVSGLAESLKSGVPVSAKIHFTPERGENRDGTVLPNGTRHEDGKNGRAIWISCTPMLGTDDRVGVWMCVVVEKSKVGSFPKSRQQAESTLETPTKSSAGAAEDTGAQGRSSGQHPQKIEIPEDATKARDVPQEQKAKQEDVPIKPVRVDSDTVITKVKAEDGEDTEATPDNDRSAKSIHQMKSVYFDAVDGQEPEHESRSQSTERAQSRERHEPQQSSADSAESRAVETPVEEYDDSVKEPDAHSEQHIDEEPAAIENSTDEYIATRSPNRESQRDKRVLIEEDSDGVSDDDIDHHHKNVEIGSPDRGRPRDARSPSPMWSPAEDSPRSVPSSAQLASEDEDEDTKVGIETPPRAQRSRSSQSLVNGIEDNSATQNVKTDGELKKAVPAATSQANIQNHDVKQDRDSSNSVDSPAKKRPTPKQARSYSYTSALSPAVQAQDPEADLRSDKREHAHDVQQWVEDARPPSSKASKDLGMDYLMAGSGRFTNPLRLTKDFMIAHQDDDQLTDLENCARSPYSVD